MSGSFLRERHWALTVSRPSASVTLIILRVADLVKRRS